MITSLTPEQEAKFPQYVEEWLGYGLSTETADRPRAEAAIKWMYAQAKLKEPRIVWADSPLAGALTAAALKSRDSVGASVGASVWDSVSDSVSDSVWDSVWASVWDSVRDSVGASVWDSVRDSVGASVRDSVRDSVSDSVWDSVRDSVSDSVSDSVRDSVSDSVSDSVRASVWDSVRGQHEASWLAFYKFFQSECSLSSQTEKLRGLWELCQSCGWIFPYENLCIATDRHRVCLLDDAGVIHNDSGPAIAYPDGFEIYAWHGTRVPAEWINTPSEVSPADVLAVEDVEQRAAGAQIIGWDRMADKLSRKIIDGDPDTDIGALIEMNLPGLSRPGRFLQAICPRNGTIVEGVPHTSDIDGKPIDTVIAAQAWRDGLPAEEYQHPTIRT